MRLIQNEDAFTGLEAAIVLIAFVVVAAVFSYVVLGAGFFTTQKSQEVVHTSVGQASSSVEVIGDVYGHGPTKVNTVEFTLGLTAGGSVVDMATTTITYSDSSVYEVLTYVADPAELDVGKWTIADIKNPVTGGTREVLERTEQFIIKVMPGTPIDINTEFTLEVKPSVGATLGLVRNTPPQIDDINVLR